MRRLTWLFTTVILLASSVLPAAAQSACPGVCITYSSPVGVPLSPTLTLLLTIVLGSSGYFFLRRKNHGFLAVVLASTLGIFSMVMNNRESVATPSYQVVLTTGNYAEVTLPSGFSGPVSVRNTQNFTVVITSITVGSGFSIDPSSTLTVGTQIPAWGTVNSAVVIAALNTPPVPTFTGFTTDASLSMNYSGQLTATDANGDILTYALETAPSVGTLVVNPNGSFTFSGSVMPGSYSFIYTVKDAGVPVAKTATITINDVAPVAGGAFASLGDMTVSDQLGAAPIVPINIWWVTDPLGRAISYSVSGLPVWLSINSNTGVISGTYDALSDEIFNVNVTASNGWLSVSKSFILTIRNDG